MTAPLAVLVRSPGRRPRVPGRFTREQGDKARVLLADGGLVRLRYQRISRVFCVVSSDGERRYLCSPEVCTCPAGKHGVACYHSLAAWIVLDAQDSVRRAVNSAHRAWRQARVLLASNGGEVTERVLALREQAQAAAALARSIRAQAGDPGGEPPC